MSRHSEAVKSDIQVFCMIGVGLFLLIGLITLVINYQKHYQEVLSKFDYEKMVSVGKDFEFTICDKMNPCVPCRSRDNLALLVQRVVREEREYNRQKEQWETDTNYYTFFTVYCGRCGRKTMSENKNLADAIYEWETKQ